MNQITDFKKSFYCINIIYLFVILSALILYNRASIHSQVLYYLSLQNNDIIQHLGLGEKINNTTLVSVLRKFGVASLFSHHSLRSLLHVPVFVISFFLKVTLEQAFNIYLYILMGIIYLALRKTYERIINQKDLQKLASLLSVNLFLSILFFINGRGILFFTGYTLLIYALTCAQFKKRYSILLLGYFYLNASSGALLDGTIVIMFIFLSELRKTVHKILSALIFLSILYPFILKNYTFFLDSDTNVSPYLGMLSHGYGKYLILDNVFLSLCFVVIIQILLFIVLRKVLSYVFLSLKKYYLITSFFNKKQPHFLLLLYVPLFGGLIGYGALSLICVPLNILLTLCLLLLLRLIKKGGCPK